MAVAQGGFGGLCFCIGYLMVTPCMEVLYGATHDHRPRSGLHSSKSASDDRAGLAGVTTAVLVCFAQNPYVLKMNNPKLFHEINDAFIVMTGQAFGVADEYDYEDYSDEEQEGGKGKGKGEEGGKKMVRFEP